MKILIADDDRTTLHLLEAHLLRWNHEPILATDGTQALQRMTEPGAPSMAILDWIMPGTHGDRLCHELRTQLAHTPPYLILLTGKSDRDDMVRGFEAGADDYVLKPFHEAELHARVRAGIRILDMQHRLGARVNELEEALARIKTLQGLLPICAWCNKIRDDRNYWQKVETYLSDHSDVRFTHCICPECRESQALAMSRHLRKAVPTASESAASKPPGP
ncbi:MAG: response regulator transcription factor [Planctomycetes bacterium]|nr:response regulator transcription factor [Planctomycetota bacterium]